MYGDTQVQEMIFVNTFNGKYALDNLSTPDIIHTIFDLYQACNIFMYYLQGYARYKD